MIQFVNFVLSVLLALGDLFKKVIVHVDGGGSHGAFGDELCGVSNAGAGVSSAVGLGASEGAGSHAAAGTAVFGRVRVAYGTEGGEDGEMACV